MYGGFALLTHELTHVLQYRRDGFRRKFSCEYFTGCLFGASFGGTRSVSCSIEQPAYLFQALVREDLQKDSDGKFTCPIGRRPDEQHDWGPTGAPLTDINQHNCSMEISDCYMKPKDTRPKYCKFVDNCPLDFNPSQRDTDGDGVGGRL